MLLVEMQDVFRNHRIEADMVSVMTHAKATPSFARQCSLKA